MGSNLKLTLVDAGTSDLVRTNQKDRYYHGYLTNVLSDILEPIIPRRYWLQWHREIQLLAEIMYYGLTTVVGNQTLGEEYCNVVQVSNSAGPVLWKRLMSVAIQIFGCYALEKLLSYAHRRLATVDRYLSNVAEMFEEVIVTSNQLQLAFFYLFGMYKLVSKRFVGIRYLKVTYQMEQKLPNPYKLLGWLVLIQLAIKYFKRIWRKFNKSSTTSRTAPTSSDQIVTPVKATAAVTSETLRCSLCLENCTGPTTPPCGHLFCWKCILDWVNDKMQCPVCRSPVKPRQLIALQSFELE